MRVEIPDPTDGPPGRPPIFVYEGVKVRPGPIGFATVMLPRWPNTPIGFVSRLEEWDAHLYLPPTGRDDERLEGRWRRREQAVAAVVHAYHWRFAKRKADWDWERERKPVRIPEDVLPPRWGRSAMPYRDWVDQRSALHRFLALNRWLFDQPTEIRPAAPVDTEETP